MVIYVDVLFCINFFITYLLLMVTALITKNSPKTYRALLSSFLGGLYSLVIFVDELSFLLSILGKLLVSFLIVLIAFGFKRVMIFLKKLFVFYFSNMLFLGIILALWLFANPDGIALKNGTAYFDISAKALIFSALSSYIISYVIIKIHNRTLAKKEIYTLKIFKDNIQYNLYAFLDSGNKLFEPFSSYPVIIVDKSKIDIQGDRIIPYNTVGGDGMLKAFKPDKIIISNGKEFVETDKVYVALSQVSSKDFSAILNPSILNI